MNSVKLYTQTLNQMSLEDAIEQCRRYLNNQAAIGLFYSANQCCFGRWQGEFFEQSNHQPLNLNVVFEARIFTSEYELRWLNQRNQIGQGVLLSESELDDKKPLDVVGTRLNTYYLWGEGVSSNSDWSVLATARIGKLDVPIRGLQPHEKVRLVTREYFGVCDDHGNVAIVEERVLRLQRRKVI